MEESGGGEGGGPETRRSMNKRASGIEGEGDPLRQWDCEREKLLSHSVRPGPAATVKGCLFERKEMQKG